MSFSSDVKDELTRVEPECSHCERAVLAALIRIEGTLRFEGAGRFSLEFASDLAAAARLVTKLLHERYALHTNLVMRRSVLHKNVNYLVDIPGQPGLTEALVDLGVLRADGGIELGISPHLVEKNCCAGAYLRGAFLGSGFVSDPKSDCHFEITVESEELAAGLISLMALKGVRARSVQRRNATTVYLKSGADIVDFLTFSGAHSSALRLEEARVMKSVRNEVNRQTNAEMANQLKISNAAVDQVFAARKVVERYGMENLSPALQEFIRLRVAYPDASLKELGSHADPPLSKSAVYHRVRRMMEMAQNIKR